MRPDRGYSHPLGKCRISAFWHVIPRGGIMHANGLPILSGVQRSVPLHDERGHFLVSCTKLAMLGRFYACLLEAHVA